MIMAEGSCNERVDMSSTVPATSTKVDVKSDVETTFAVGRANVHVESAPEVLKQVFPSGGHSSILLEIHVHPFGVVVKIVINERFISDRATIVDWVLCRKRDGVYRRDHWHRPVHPPTADDL